MKAYIGQFDEQPYYGNRRYAPIQFPMTTYAAKFTNRDKQTGGVMALLKELAFNQNTLVMFNSVNGVDIVNPPFKRKEKFDDIISCYDKEIRVFTSNLVCVPPRGATKAQRNPDLCR